MPCAPIAGHTTAGKSSRRIESLPYIPPMKIAVDAMGGDHAPVEVVRGAVQAARELDLPVILVGREDLIRDELRACGAVAGTVDVVHASEVVEMCEVPGTAIRKKKESSIRI